MRFPRSFRSAIPLVLACAMFHGCGESGTKNSPKPAPTADTGKHVSANLPAGRFQLPTTHTPAPNLWITLPAGYTVKETGKLPDDVFFVVRLDDPSARDTTKVTPGFMRVYVGPRPQHAFGTTPAREGKRVFVGGQPLTWHELDEPLSDGRRYLKRELAASGFFASLSPELARTPLHLHVYIAGSDSARVAELMRSAESISIAP